MGFKLEWDAQGEKLYETGCDRGVLYVWDSNAAEGETPWYGTGVEWNGLTNVSESPSGAEASPLYADNIKYLNLMSAEEFGCSIEAYTYPDEFGECDGSKTLWNGVSAGQQTRKTFAFSYRTLLGNDTEDTAYGYKIHLIYGCKASPSEKSYATVNDSPEAISFSWEISTTPININIEGFKPTACITIDSTKVTEAQLTALENLLYGVTASGSAEGSDPQMPTIAQLTTIFGTTSGGDPEAQG